MSSSLKILLTATSLPDLDVAFHTAGPSARVKRNEVQAAKALLGTESRV